MKMSSTWLTCDSFPVTTAWFQRWSWICGAKARDLSSSMKNPAKEKPEIMARIAISEKTNTKKSAKERERERERENAEANGFTALNLMLQSLGYIRLISHEQF